MFKDIFLTGAVKTSNSGYNFQDSYAAMDKTIGSITVRDGVVILLAAIALILFIIAIWVFLYTKEKSMPRIREYIRRAGIHLDFGLATRDEVYEKFGEEVGNIIIDERKIVFWRLGWIWAIPGTIFGIIIYKLSQLMIQGWLKW